ncbi:MAG TPA: hypothetical protein PLF13_00820 [candidate division Zixibacteria bacterium]|nr:hypothetical protein [candidate division Zixibacteria bacterium]
MTEENNNAEAQQATPEPAPAKSGGMMKYIIIGLVAVVVVAGVSVVALKMMSGGDTVSQTEEATEPAEHSETTNHPDSTKAAQAEVAHTPTAEEIAEELTEGMTAQTDDPSLLGDIMENLAFLDYQPEAEDIPGMEMGMSQEDSIENMNWLDREKARLADREKGLDQREQEVNNRYRELQKLENEVNRKLLVLEQAETARISSLAKLYDGMDPRSVAQLAENLDDETMVALIPRMKTKNASSLLALMPPQRAARLSQKMITISEK